MQFYSSTPISELNKQATQLNNAGDLAQALVVLEQVSQIMLSNASGFAHTVLDFERHALWLQKAGRLADALALLDRFEKAWPSMVAHTYQVDNDTVSFGGVGVEAVRKTKALKIKQSTKANQEQLLRIKKTLHTREKHDLQNRRFKPPPPATHP